MCALAPSTCGSLPKHRRVRDRSPRVEQFWPYSHCNPRTAPSLLTSHRHLTELDGAFARLRIKQLKHWDKVIYISLSERCEIVVLFNFTRSSKGSFTLGRETSGRVAVANAGGRRGSVVLSDFTMRPLLTPVPPPLCGARLKAGRSGSVERNESLKGT